jgi:transposase, IS5 family
MLIDRYAPEDVFARVPELAGQTDPVLKQLDVLLEDDQLFQQVKADLTRRFPHTADRGRHSTPVEAILRLLLIKHLYNWSFQQTEERVADSLVLRWFCRVYFRRVPDDTTLIRWAQIIRPETVQALNERVVQLATRANVTQGRKLRVDATCVPTNIHHPTDSGLLVDSVRVLSRIMQRAKPLLAQTRKDAAELCQNHLRSARRIGQALHRLLRRKGEEKLEQQRELYERLVQTTEEVVQQTQRVSQALRRRTEQAAENLREQMQQFLPLVRRVIAQTRRRVLEGQKVPSEEKVLSMFEPHTRVIPRHKGGAEVEFGRLVTLDEVEGGIITRFEVLEQPNEHGQGEGALKHHLRLFGHPPRLVAGDRGIHSASTQRTLEEAGVQVVAIPAVGKISAKRQAVEHSPPFRRGYRWRAGIEGRIHSLRRDYGLRRCAYHGMAGLKRWLGWGIMASNLKHIAQAKATRSRQKQAA